MKTDWYELSQTPNFFFERFSSRQKPGGPWQALEHGVDVFVYFFIHDMRYYSFPTRKLVAALEKIIPKYLVNIPNKGYTTQGFTVKRELLKALYTEHTIQTKVRTHG